MIKKLKYAAVFLVCVTTLNLSAGSDNPAFSSAQWYFNLRTNVNSAAIVTGVAAAWHTLYYGLLPAAKAGLDYSLGNKEKAAQAFKKARGNFTTSMFLVGLSLGIEAVNTYYLRNKFYESVNS